MGGNRYFPQARWRRGVADWRLLFDDDSPKKSLFLNTVVPSNATEDDMLSPNPCSPALIFHFLLAFIFARRINWTNGRFAGQT
jgi:hypothetical protein